MARLLREFLPVENPNLLRDCAQDPTLIDSIPEPLRRVVRELYEIARPVFEEKRTLKSVTEVEREALLKVLGYIADTERVDEQVLALTAISVREMLDVLKDEFVPAQIAHQYGSDGSYSDMDAFAQLLTACYPDWDFDLDEVVQLDQHGPILDLRGWAATFILIASAWLVGHALDEWAHQHEVRIVRRFLETRIFRSPDGDIHPQTFHIRYDPSRGCEFDAFDENSAQHTSVFSMLPRFIHVAESDLYQRVLLEFRNRKNAASWVRKCLMGREVGDGIAFRIIVRTHEEWVIIRPVLDRLLCDPAVGGDPDIIDGVRVNGAHNGDSVIDPGVLWKGKVRIPGVEHNRVELQVILFSTWWNRLHSLSAASDAFYKFKQWTRKMPAHESIPGSLLSPIQLVFPPTLFPEWRKWEFLSGVMQQRLMAKAANPCRSEPEVNEYIERVFRYFKDHPKQFKLSDED